MWGTAPRQSYRSSFCLLSPYRCHSGIVEAELRSPAAVVAFSYPCPMGLAFSARLLGPRLVRVKPSEPSGERQMLGWPVVVPAHRGHRRPRGYGIIVCSQLAGGPVLQFGVEDFFPFFHSTLESRLRLEEAEDIGRVVSRSIWYHCHQTVNCQKGTTQTYTRTAGWQAKRPKSFALGKDLNFLIFAARRAVRWSRCFASPRRESIVGTISQRHRRDEGREEQEREFRSSPTMAPLSRGASCVALSRRVFGSLSLRLPKMRCTHPKAWAPSAEKLHAKSPKSHVLPRL